MGFGHHPRDIRTGTAGTSLGDRLREHRRAIVGGVDSARAAQVGLDVGRKRWKVAHVLPGGAVDEIELRLDNPAYSPRRVGESDGAIRIVAGRPEIVE